MSTDVLGKWTCGSCTLNAVVEKLSLLKLNRVDFALWNFFKNQITFRFINFRAQHPICLSMVEQGWHARGREHCLADLWAMPLATFDLSKLF